MKDRRGITFHFNDGTRITLDFPRQTENPAAMQLKLEDVLDSRCAMFEVEGTLLMIPFENVKYIQAYPAPAQIRGRTYVTGALLVE
jgi:hypothetical protein